MLRLKKILQKYSIHHLSFLSKSN